jgi:hypothetical protein
MGQSVRKFVEQCLGVFQISNVEAFLVLPPVYRPDAESVPADACA